MSKKLYHERDIETLDDAGGFYFRHVMAMTSEQLHSKSDIAAELGFRDMLIDEFESKLLAMKAERDALLVYAIDAEKWFNKHDPHGYVSPKRADAQAALAAHDAEVAKKAVQAALRMYGSTDLNNKEIIALSESYAASLNK